MNHMFILDPISFAKGMAYSDGSRLLLLPKKNLALNFEAELCCLEELGCRKERERSHVPA